MTLSRREFLRVLGAAAAAGVALDATSESALDASLYDVPRFGNVSLLHFTDCHAQLLPIYFREPGVNIGVGAGANRPPHLVGRALLRAFDIGAGTPEAYALTHLDFERAAWSFGKVGGFAHLATLVKKLRAERPASLLLDGGDTWQGSATALWSRGEDMMQAQKLLGVDIMTAHWEFTYGADRVQQAVKSQLAGKIEFLAQNVKTHDFGDPVFDSYSLRELGGIAVAVIGQAFPYTPIANPRYFVPEWTFGIDEERLQSLVDESRARGAQVVVLLSHNGIDVDLKLASRVTGLDAIFGGHTHDGVPRPVVVANRSGRTLVTNAGSNGKFLAVLDLEVKQSGVTDYRYRLLPVFSRFLAPDSEMAALIERIRAPHREKLQEKLAVSEGLLYRRASFNGSFDQVILDALMEVKGTQIAFSPGFRWGTTLLPGETITFERLMDQTAITYPMTYVAPMYGVEIKTVLEDVCDNLFNPDPYKQQGGDMARVGGLTYSCSPNAAFGRRISDMRLGGRPVEAGKSYTVAGWASVAAGIQGEPVWEVVAQYLRSKGLIRPPRVSVPRLIGVAGNRGIG